MTQQNTSPRWNRHNAIFMQFKRKTVVELYSLTLIFKPGIVHSHFWGNSCDQVDDHMEPREVDSSRPDIVRFASSNVALASVDIVELTISEYWSRKAVSLTPGFWEVTEDGDESSLGWNQLPVKSIIHLSDQ